MVLVQDVKKGFYKKFLYEPFPVESSLLAVLADHLNAEVVAGTIQTRQDALDYMTWTFFFRRLLQNPSYYGMEEVEDQGLNTFLSGVVGKALDELELSYCYCLETAGLSTPLWRGGLPASTTWPTRPSSTCGTVSRRT